MPGGEQRGGAGTRQPSLQDQADAPLQLVLWANSSLQPCLARLRQSPSGCAASLQTGRSDGQHPGPPGMPAPSSGRGTGSAGRAARGPLPARTWESQRSPCQHPQQKELPRRAPPLQAAPSLTQQSEGTGALPPRRSAPTNPGLGEHWHCSSGFQRLPPGTPARSAARTARSAPCQTGLRLALPGTEETSSHRRLLPNTRCMPARLQPPLLPTPPSAWVQTRSPKAGKHRSAGNQFVPTDVGPSPSGKTPRPLRQGRGLEELL